jgi:hypothetical protein
MGKSHHKGGARKPATRPAARRGPPDGAVYIALLLIGGFAVWLWSIVDGDDDNAWKHATLVYVAAVLVFVNFCTWQVYFGKRIAAWKQSLARLSLRWAGYGTRRGRPLEAAHGSRAASMLLILSMATSVVLVVVLAWLMYGI